MFCHRCSYTLDGITADNRLTEYECPECGKAFLLWDKSTFRTASSRTRRRLVIWGGLLILVLGGYHIGRMGVKYFDEAAFKEQNKLISELKSLGAYVVDERPHRWAYVGEKIGLRHLTEVYEVFFVRGFQPEALDIVAQLGTVEVLRVWVDAKDSDYAPVSRMHTLKLLQVVDANLTDEGLSHFRGLDLDLRQAYFERRFAPSRKI